MNFVVFDHEVRPTDRVGGKAAALARLRSGGFDVPRWFAVTPAAFAASLTPDLRRGWEQSGDPAAAAEVARRLQLTTDVRIAVERAVAAAGARWFAVRSSALEEDGSEHSFAGQLESYLQVAPADVPEKILAVWRSGFSPRLLAYRAERGLPLRPEPPAVLVQEMVAAESAGVAFAADPVSGRRGVAVVAAVWGLGTSLVGGDDDADTFHVDRAGRIVARRIVEKRRCHALGAAGGIVVEEVPVELVWQPALEDAEIAAVAALARRCSEQCGQAQDIEWALAGKRLFLLQSRPITSLRALADPDGELRVWDNSNIAESYSGVTTPLTFSFARSIYEEVYRQFCKLMGVPPPRVDANRELFAQMLGLVGGRIYYNLLNWYRILALLPGFALNRRFMEQMMGVKEGLPPAVLAQLSRVGLRDRVADAWHLARTLAGLAVNHFALPRNIARFRRRLDAALALPGPALTAMRPDELVAHYHDLERQLLTRWDAPLVNDFFAMIFYGLLRRLTAAWCDDRAGTLQNDLICGEGGMISTEPARRVRHLAELAAADPALVELLCESANPDLAQELKAWPEFAVAYASYLEKFGDRCLGELKLESATLHDEPLPLLRSIGQYARRFVAGQRGAEAEGDTELRQRAERTVAGHLRGRPGRKIVFGWVLRQARARVRDRENLRFERTRLFGRVRRIFLELGRRFTAEGALEAPRDVFSLTTAEVIGYLEGTAVTTELKALVALRQAEFARHQCAPAPADRFETRGLVYLGHTFRGTATAAAMGGEMLAGTGCCPGIVRGRARVVFDPRGAVVEPGEILVAQRTDPGWIMLFPAAAGLLVEHGSLLSHSAIVAREMGIPAVVAIAGLTAWVQTGDVIELDGSTGSVRKLEAAA